jgi:hypothetical protein
VSLSYSAGIYDMLQNLDMGLTALLPFQRKVCCGFISPSAEFESTNLGSSAPPMMTSCHVIWVQHSIALILTWLKSRYLIVKKHSS